jgi:hypothetical protein
MSKLTIVDLNKAEELSSAEMTKVSGGLECGPTFVVAANILAAGESLKQMGYGEAGGILTGEAHGLVAGACDP